MFCYNTGHERRFHRSGDSNCEAGRGAEIAVGTMKIIEVKPLGRGWEVSEASGLEPLFIGRDGRRLAIGYAKTRQEFSQREIRVLNSAGEVVETISFDDSGKKF